MTSPIGESEERPGPVFSRSFHQPYGTHPHRSESVVPTFGRFLWVLPGWRQALLSHQDGQLW
jgi:hypothetical protein